MSYYFILLFYQISFFCYSIAYYLRGTPLLVSQTEDKYFTKVLWCSNIRRQLCSQSFVPLFSLAIICCFECTVFQFSNGGDGIEGIFFCYQIYLQNFLENQKRKMLCRFHSTIWIFKAVINCLSSGKTSFKTFSP